MRFFYPAEAAKPEKIRLECVSEFGRNGYVLPMIPKKDEKSVRRFHNFPMVICKVKLHEESVASHLKYSTTNKHQGSE